MSDKIAFIIVQFTHVEGASRLHLARDMLMNFVVISPFAGNAVRFPPISQESVFRTSARIGGGAPKRIQSDSIKPASFNGDAVYEKRANLRRKSVKISDTILLLHT